MKTFILLCKLAIGHLISEGDVKKRWNGSLTIDSALMEAADIAPFERVEVANLNNGKRFSTYVIEGKKGNGEFCLNGATARLGEIGDLIIVFTYVHLLPDEIKLHHPAILQMGEGNKIKAIQK